MNQITSGLSKVTLVIPCFNEEKRVDLKAFETGTRDGIHFLFVDDGSTDQTYSKITNYFKGHPQVQVLKLAKNSGKAGAIWAGFDHHAKSGETDPNAWWGYWDADLATPLDEVAFLLNHQRTFHPEKIAIFGSRVYKLGSAIRRSPLRHYLGRVFATLVSILLQIEAYDTQCGAKLFKARNIGIGFKEPFLSKWIFDVELLLRLGQSSVVEIPLRRWQDVKGSKVNLSRESIRVFFDILKIRKRYLKS